ncbi:MAG: hypothetical protein ISP41_12490 [Alphaproteobacteria bacterium]|nr:hypothetical protein [Alphaproteobacteria bacterium]
MSRRLLYLLIEEADRELKSRALIATVAVERGFDVVLLPQWTAWRNWGVLPPGIVLFKGNNAAQCVEMREAKRHGHLVASIEEETLGVIGEGEIHRCYAPAVAEVCDIIFANGASQADVLRARFGALSGSIHVVGNPRVDLLKSGFIGDIHAAAADLRRRYGDFVLINTNFSSINPRDGDTLEYFDTCVGVGVVDPRRDDDLDDFFTWCAWERTNLGAVGEFVQRARERSPWPLIIRPHPTENLAPWMEMVSGMDDSVRVIREGDHLAWTAAARVLVHPGCTTGTEALLLDTPAVSLTVDDNPWHELYLSNLVNPRARSIDDALDMVVDLAEDGEMISRNRDTCFENLTRHIATGPEHYSCVAIVDILDAAPVPRASVERISDLENLAPVVATEGKIDSERFARKPVETLMASYRETLGYRGSARVLEPAPGVLHCAPVARVERAE